MLSLLRPYVCFVCAMLFFYHLIPDFGVYMA